MSNNKLLPHKRYSMDSPIPSLIQSTPKSGPPQQYRVGQFLGKGGFARCYQATDLSANKQVAIKVINKKGLQKSRAKQKLLLEIKIHRNLNHPYIVKFDSVFEDETNVYIVLELCTCRTLNEMVKKRKCLTPPEVRYYMLQLISALEYLHSIKVIHRDLKMGNIFLSHSMDLKLGDFGLCAKLEYVEERKMTMAGTPNYIAPEIIDGSGGHSYQVDLWSTGVICYALLYGRPPFETSDLKMTYARIKNCEYNFPSSIDVPQAAKDFIKRILVLDPLKRLSLKQMKQHPFLTEQVPNMIPHTALVEVPTFLFQRAKQNNLTDPKISHYPLTEKQLPKTTENTFKSLKVLHEKNKNGEHTTITDFTEQPRSQLTKDQFVFGVVVTEHVDYSAKYGLGYRLSNGSQGVYFNDSTLLSLNGRAFNYIYLENPSHSDQVHIYSDAQFPTDRNLIKKKALLERIQAHLSTGSSLSKQAKQQSGDRPPVYIKQWLKTKHAIMFRLSNNIFQVDFFDRSQILLHTEHRMIKFTSKRGEERQVMLSEVMGEPHDELGRRIKYTRDILNSLKKQQQ